MYNIPGHQIHLLLQHGVAQNIIGNLELLNKYPIRLNLQIVVELVKLQFWSDAQDIGVY
jgi:hypothetical protein